MDAFQVNWSQLKGYAFPPFAMLGRCLAKVVQDRATLVAITPTWRTQPWFPRLLSMAIASPISVASTTGYVDVSAAGETPQQERHPLVLNGTLSLAAWKISGDER